MSGYLAILFTAALATARLGLQLPQWCGLVAVSVVTFVLIRVEEKGCWTLGLRVPTRLGARDLALGCSVAATLVAAVDVVIRASLSAPYIRGGGVPFAAMIVTYIPAVFHEELLFRGYAYQKLRQRGVTRAIACSSILFALLHAGNRGVTLLACVNLALGGVLLALLYERHRRLWLPIGFHLAWNIASGPLLGWPVAGSTPATSLVRAAARGAGSLLTGGTFGIQASVVVTFVEIYAIVQLARGVARRHRVDSVRNVPVS